MNIFEHVIFVQGLGFIALIIGLLTMIQTCDKKFKILNASGHVIMGLHYALLGAVSGALISAMSFTRNILSFHGNIKPVAFLLIAAYIGFGIWSYQNWHDVLPPVAASLGTFGMFYLSGIRFRLCILGASSCYLCYNIMVGSIAPAFAECLFISLNIKTILSLMETEKALKLRPLKGLT